jgi:hypothetical protein
MMTPAASFSVSLFTAILLYSITGMAQSISIEEKTSDIVPATDTKSIDSFEKPIDPATEVTPEAAATGILKSPRMPDLSVFESLEEHDMRDDKYVASVDLAGLVDLNAAGSLGGLGNSATVTFRYDLRRNHDEHSVRMSVFFVYISYKISIPFGG